MDLTEQEKLENAREKIEVEKQVKQHLENMERIKKEKLEKRKSNQNDLIYQINEKEKMRYKDNHDKMLEERTAKILEAEYLRRIADYKQIQNKRVIFVLKFLKIFNFIFLFRLRMRGIRNIEEIII